MNPGYRMHMPLKDFFVRPPVAKLPGALREQLPAADEPLGAVPVSPTGERWAVASRQALLLVGADGVESRDTWDTVDRGSWNGEERSFHLEWLEAQRPALQLQVPLTLDGVDVDPDLFARVLRQRVESAIVHRVSEVLPSGNTANISVRRGADGELYSVCAVQSGAGGRQRLALSDLSSTDLEAVRALESRARDGVGLHTSGV